ncbi:pentapeptide repeat-containing protein [Nocardia neocaledoniensis]|uniref:pentapeptide repeat-containing protein n=1 Tax=Nocardia neocaledoniensis TaxID=236511 RepID=UPI0024581816|nr:pentapeptide repeat-containing protein [Nocardia neocaledoniensis]
MTKGERPARSGPVELRWRTVGLMVGGAGMAGFGAAVLSGVDTGLSQPWATLLGGTGVLAAGILTYVNGRDTRKQAEEHHNEQMARERERHADDTERAREAALWERFGAAAAQLADKSAAIRIAGVYAMAGVADERSGANRQQCIDVLCGYLRLPYDPEQGGSGRTKLVTKTAGADGAEQEEHTEYRQNDREVRATILRAIADHLRPQAEHSWSSSDFDFRTAHLESVDFSMAKFAGIARFDRATFASDTHFDRATFSGDTRFDRANFSDDACFIGATFAGSTRFGNATFAGNAWFGNATFAGNAWFDRATFARQAGFNDATFANGARFGEATFASCAGFNGVTFAGAAEFSCATFAEVAEFNDATFSAFAGFSFATFADNTWFDRATFAGGVWFDRAAVAGIARFNRATFAGGAKFDNAIFSNMVGFHRATFAGGAGLDSATSSDYLRGRFSFLKVDFGTEFVSFGGPQEWGPPAPTFDWDEDLSQKPANVEPQDWPPAVAVPPPDA